MTKRKCKYGCRLWIDTDDEDPYSITELTGIMPTNIEIKGAPQVPKKNPGPQLYHEQNIWELKPPARIANNEWDLCDSIEDVVNILDRHEDAFRKHTAKFENKGLLIYCNVHNTGWIQFRIQPEILQKMSKYGIIIDFLILGSYDEEYFAEEEWITVNEDTEEDKNENT